MKDSIFSQEMLFKLQGVCLLDEYNYDVLKALAFQHLAFICMKILFSSIVFGTVFTPQLFIAFKSIVPIGCINILHEHLCRKIYCLSTTLDFSEISNFITNNFILDPMIVYLYNSYLQSVNIIRTFCKSLETFKSLILSLQKEVLSIFIQAGGERLGTDGYGKQHIAIGSGVQVLVNTTFGIP